MSGKVLLVLYIDYKLQFLKYQNQLWITCLVAKQYIKGKTKLMFGSYGINRVNKK